MVSVAGMGPSTGSFEVPVVSRKATAEEQESQEHPIAGELASDEASTTESSGTQRLETESRGNSTVLLARAEAERVL